MIGGERGLGEGTQACLVSHFRFPSLRFVAFVYHPLLQQIRDRIATLPPTPRIWALRLYSPPRGSACPAKE
ncbi:Mitochondrial Dynamics Protein Mid49 [Manis pentadactyla]|nr:Mitochondrial Dynamics Protein Mid49 [Manis pentadactyla]